MHPSIGTMENNKTKPLDDILSPIARKKSSHVSVFTDFCRLAACALAMQTREEEYLEVSGKYDREELDSMGKALGVLVEIMQGQPYTDVLGIYYLDVASRFSKKDRGEFYTPTCIAEFMARVTIDAGTIRERGTPVRVNEPTCGSGNMILALAKILSPDGVALLRVTGQDISPLACDMCYINTTLWGIPARIIWGDTLMLEEKMVWTNIHWHRVGEDFLEKFRRLRKVTEVESQQPEPPKGQMTFEW